MSEYQYYEFLALDRPLTAKQRAELRSISSRAEITATRFTEYREATSVAAQHDGGLEARRTGNWEATASGTFRLPARAAGTVSSAQACCSPGAASEGQLGAEGEHGVVEGRVLQGEADISLGEFS